LVGRTVTAARARAGGAQAERVVGSTVEAVEAVGKNLLLRFDNGLEIRTHLRMNGSWHRYRPGEPWRRPASRARLVLEVPGAVAVCFDAPAAELFEARSEAIHPTLGRLGPEALSPLRLADRLTPAWGVGADDLLVPQLPGHQCLKSWWPASQRARVGTAMSPSMTSAQPPATGSRCGVRTWSGSHPARPRPRISSGDRSTSCSSASRRPRSCAHSTSRPSGATSRSTRL